MTIARGRLRGERTRGGRERGERRRNSRVGEGGATRLVLQGILPECGRIRAAEGERNFGRVVRCGEFG